MAVAANKTRRRRTRIDVRKGRNPLVPRIIIHGLFTVARFPAMEPIFFDVADFVSERSWLQPQKIRSK
jgi:hypothetical protein